ncbi:MAG: hypothetical protein AABX16_05500 [Nanoarchaeota archaeon]
MTGLAIKGISDIINKKQSAAANVSNTLEKKVTTFHEYSPHKLLDYNSTIIEEDPAKRLNAIPYREL